MRGPRLAFMPSLVCTMLVGALGLAGCPQDDLVEVHPVLKVTPEVVHLTNIPIAADTPITLTLTNASAALLEGVAVALEEPHDPAFTLLPSQPTQVAASGTAFIQLLVRPLAVTTLETRLIVTAVDDAVPSNRVEVPITVEAADLGLPDIQLDPGPSAGIDFARIGRNDVVRASVTIENVGVRDLIVDETALVADVEGDTSIHLTTPVPAGFAIQPAESISLDLVFAPTDTAAHSATLRVRSNDPDEHVVVLPIRGQGHECPTALAVLVDDASALQPFDTVRLDGTGSTPASIDTTIDTYVWSLEQRPLGSTAVPAVTDQARTELTADVAGDYVVRLDVVDSTGARSCEPSLVPLHVVPQEDLHVQLVWDHPTADVDLHIVREGGELFDHDGDCYFSNKKPDWFPATPEMNPTLDVDDDRGYGPENANIEHPLPGSKWSVLVHYWNAQSAADPRTIATLRVFVFGQQAIELTQTFTTDQTLWHAVEIDWPQDPTTTQPTLTQLGILEPKTRPF